jgi:hypothetical protein
MRAFKLLYLTKNVSLTPGILDMVHRINIVICLFVDIHEITC